EGRNTHRTLLRLGEVTALRASGELERIIAALENHLQRDQVAVASMSAEDTRVVGSVAGVAAVWARLGLDVWFAKQGADRGAEVLSEAVFAMVANRLIDPCSKRRLLEWVDRDIAMPEGWTPPSLDQYYRALDAVAAGKAATEIELYARLCDLTNMDLSMVCYDLTSTYFEGDPRPTGRFPSKAFGYSRDKRSDRPQVVIGLLCTGDGIPIAHHVFAGSTADVSTLPGVLADLAERFSVTNICVVADRGLISAANIDDVDARGFDHIVATRLHRDAACAGALTLAEDEATEWVEVAAANSRAAEVTLADGTRAVVVESDERHRRDTARTAELVARCETQLLALEDRVRAGRLKNPAAIGRAAQKILGSSGVAGLFEIEISEGRFLYHYNDPAHDYEQQLAGRYVLTTNLTTAQASTARIVTAYRQLLAVENRFRTLKDLLHLRPVRHWTEQRVKGHIAICVYAAVVETLIGKAITAAGITDPDIDDQHLSAQRALRELGRVRHVQITAGGRQIGLITRRSTLQAQILAALKVDTRGWDTAEVA
ncbi:IS1634 family transposase, partial [Mycobacterium sp.]|uniref:IS1634 family transposase n=1 Tax=Mycobacterium sp. TaxID=1785 RepID=UPI003A8869FF